MLRDERTWSFRAEPNRRIVELDIALTAQNKEVVLGDTKEGTFALRMAPSLRVRGAHATGSCHNSAGDQNKACWGKRAQWVSFRR